MGFARPVAFRPHLSMGLALFYRKKRMVLIALPELEASGRQCSRYLMQVHPTTHLLEGVGRLSGRTRNTLREIISSVNWKTAIQIYLADNYDCIITR
jgi:hypothetical protein